MGSKFRGGRIKNVVDLLEICQLGRPIRSRLWAFTWAKRQFICGVDGWVSCSADCREQFLGLRPWAWWAWWVMGMLAHMPFTVGGSLSLLHHYLLALHP